MKKITKVRTEINEIETRKTIGKKSQRNYKKINATKKRETN